MKEKDDKILLAQVSDKIEMCENKNKIEYTNFLDLAQIELVQNYIDKLKIENTQLSLTKIIENYQEITQNNLDIANFI